MKIKRLELKAYGHFTDRVIDFSSDTPGLHIIYGPNEAGKSTALRALQGLLYGIPMRTADNFFHDYNRLMIGGQLENAVGKELSFWRRKKNIGDLLDADQQPMDPNLLHEFLQGIEEPLFQALFGIDHETLVSGGRDILEQKGDIGQALFSAGAGLSALHGLIAAMDKECELLFKSGGSKPELNQAIKEYQELKKEIRNKSLSSSQWSDQQELFSATSAELEQIDKQKRDLGIELERLKRLHRAIPHLHKRAQLQNRLAELGSYEHLPADFSERLRSIREAQQHAEKLLQDARSRQVVLETDKSNVSFRQDILDQAETIDALHQALGVQRQAAKDRPSINNQLNEVRIKAETLLNQIGPSLSLSRPEEIKGLLERKNTILPLSKRFAVLERALGEASTKVDRLTAEKAHLELQLNGLPEVGDVRGLNAAVVAAQKAGDLDHLIRTHERDSVTLISRARADVQQIGLWTAPLDMVTIAELPSAVTIDMYVDQYREIDEKQRRHHQDQENIREELDQVQKETTAIRKAGAVATEDDLSQARISRDRGWQLVKKIWLDGETLDEEVRAYAENSDLSTAFENRMHSADDMSDQMRSAADRVYQYANLIAESEKLTQQHQRLMTDAAEMAQKKTQMEKDWQELWGATPVQPRSPREMRSWLDQFNDIRRLVRESEQKASETQPLIQQRQQRIAALLSALTGLGYEHQSGMDELTSVLTYAEQALSELQGISEQRRKMQNDEERNRTDFQKAAGELQEAEEAMKQWTEQWSEALAGFSLPHDASAEDAENALEALRSCLDAVASIEAFQQRLEEIDLHADQFNRSVRSLVESVSPELGEFPSDQAVVKLQAMVRAAEKNKTILEKIEEGLSGTREEIRQGTVECQVVSKELLALRGLARCETDDELVQIEASFRDYLATAGELRNLEEMLTGIAEGIDVGALEQQRLEIDPNELPGRIDGLARQITDELEPQIKILSEKKGAAFNELQKMDGSGEAAAMEIEAQAALAKVRRLADRYLRVRLGNQLLKREIERYRKEHQDPILKTASRYFSELTLGGFPGLRSDLDDNGQQILVGVCPDGAVKTVDAMSSGTRDQLYLALRLATLEWRLGKHEAMPFIADDILVNFDDARSTATLQALADLATKNQVILFTHHRRIIETAESLGMDGHVIIHDLVASSQPE